MNKLERKFGKYAIKNLSLIIVICYAVGYLISNIPSLSLVLDFLTLNPYKIVRGQIWRLFTWIIVPPYEFDLLTLITLYFYYSIGRSLERVWGDFLYNLYFFSGLIFTVLGAFAIYLYAYVVVGGGLPLELSMVMLSKYINTYYINMSLFLAFAFTFPEARVLFMFIIPVKVKWLGYLYGVYIAYDIIRSGQANRIIIVSSLLNFLVFYLWVRKTSHFSPRAKIKQAIRRREYNQNVKAETKMQSESRHKCAICGRTEKDMESLDFRYCSKCKGNYEYCSDHLFTHVHKE